MLDYNIMVHGVGHCMEDVEAWQYVGLHYVNESLAYTAKRQKIVQELE